MKNSKLKIVVIDNDYEMLELYSKFLTEMDAYELIGTYTSIHETLKSLNGIRPDVIISEVSLQGVSGIDGIGLLKKKNPKAKVIMVSSKSDFEIIKKAFKMGANGYLTKPVTKVRLLEAINSVMENGAALSHDVAQKVIAMFQKQRYQSLSKRENQIAEYLGQGATYKSIAQKLFVTPSTVNFHIQNIYVKLNVNSKSEALEKLRLLAAS